MTSEQLPLLPTVSSPLALRLPERTRRAGLAGVAQARLVLDDAARRRAEHEAQSAAHRRRRVGAAARQSAGGLGGEVAA